jgi:hypothetical protein
MGLSLDHIQIAMPPGQEPAALAARGGLWLALGPHELHLGVETPFTPARKAHPGFLTDDIEPLAARLSQAGHPVAWDDAIPTRKRFFTEDPFGNRLEFLAAPLSSF